MVRTYYKFMNLIRYYTLKHSLYYYIVKIIYARRILGTTCKTITGTRVNDTRYIIYLLLKGNMT